jgi:hypothetical protein
MHKMKMCTVTTPAAAQAPKYDAWSAPYLRTLILHIFVWLKSRRKGLKRLLTMQYLCTCPWVRGSVQCWFFVWERQQARLLPLQSLPIRSS